jgi:hypothetical protein
MRYHLKKEGSAVISTAWEPARCWRSPKILKILDEVERYRADRSPE